MQATQDKVRIPKTKPMRPPKYQPWHVTNVTLVKLDLEQFDEVD